MVCTADDLLNWKDFPKGLKVLLLYEDITSAVETKSRLEQMDYVDYWRIGTPFARTAGQENFLHPINSTYGSIRNLMVLDLSVRLETQKLLLSPNEVSSSNNDGTFRFLETAKELPIILTSNTHCLSTMMKCIALGAVEFLQTPLSDDKLRNIWQHVMHKAFNDAGKDVHDSLKPVKDSVISMLQLSLAKDKECKHSSKTETFSVIQEKHNLSSGGDKFPAPSTPQIKQGGRLLDDGDCQDQTNFSTERVSGEQDVESKSIDTICCNSAAENSCFTSSKQQLEAVSIKEEHQSADNSEMAVSHCSENQDPASHPSVNVCDLSKPEDVKHSSGSKSNRKKIKVDWTPELHKKFVQAVEQLGVDHAIPSRILELMKVEGLTRHNVASHLQKYRMHRRHILPKEDERRWPNPRDATPRSYYPVKPVMTFPTYSPNHVQPTNQGYPPAWLPLPPGSCYQNGVHIWGSHYYPGWQPAENWLWRRYPGVHADAWGCPVMPPLGPASFTPFPQNPYDCRGSHAMQTRGSVVQNLFDLHPAEEVIDKIVKDAISKPWLPLPLGLKPPSTECVLSELSRQGISSIPPKSSSSGSHVH